MGVVNESSLEFSPTVPNMTITITSSMKMTMMDRMPEISAPMITCSCFACFSSFTMRITRAVWPIWVRRGGIGSHGEVAKVITASKMFQPEFGLPPTA